ncbi:MAG TPA: glycogen/starch/alpha-glucan phosphorylase [Kiritimatiellia bacterium]|nr:glycogen/starch/alpha-glucan phosphorylase [Kiritimatiellia bacterium]HPS07236.1 glycogen/starch/alpha-glucan phosphorylase [Kiritimatiellia bacterium]
MEQKATRKRCRDRRVEMSVEGLKADFAWHIRYTQARTMEQSTPLDLFNAFAYCVRDRLIERWLQTRAAYHVKNVKVVYYLSLEFLIGRLLGNNVINLKMDEICREALQEEGIDWNSLRDCEVDAGLGNGGLGRLAACFLDSMTTLNLAAMGYGLRYDYGIFKQRIVDGQQVEEPDHWLKNGTPWEVARPEQTQVVHFGGRVECITNGRVEWRWVDAEKVLGVPYDLPVVGYGQAVNILRLWSAKADDEFHLDDFNKGSYVDAVENKVLAENLTKVLYPNDNVLAGKELRLRQQYFFISCTLQDILRRFRFRSNDWTQLPEKVFIQLNETHPALIIPELMRLLVDREGIDWNTAWSITRACTGYTNHTILPEALEKWSVSLMERLLPRHMQIIYEINGRFLKQVAAMWPGDVGRLARMSIIDEHGDRSVRMANLAIIGSSSVNGVSQLHTEILKASLFKDFYEFYPTHFSNKTNGITQRRWLLKANKELAGLITEAIGPGWITELDELRGLEKYAADKSFLDKFRKVKQANKERLAAHIRSSVGIAVSPDAIFDVQVKRLHEYKRQLLLALYIIVLYNRLVANPSYDPYPRAFIFAAKAAPGYAMAKLIIRLIHGIADVVNFNPNVKDKLSVVFLPDYRVSLAEKIIPAANVSEQISLAGTEASGTGNMKLMLNGALTLGTLDGANVEIHEAVGDDNMFLFGLRAEQVRDLRPVYSSRAIYHADPEIRRAIDMIRRNVFGLLTPGLFDPIVRSLLDYNDHYMLLADLRDYIETQDKVEALYREPYKWDRKALINVARSGRFSSDRTIREYARDIWHVEPVVLTQDQE